MTLRPEDWPRVKELFEPRVPAQPSCAPVTREETCAGNEAL
jgi:hypothetical protein